MVNYLIRRLLLLPLTLFAIILVNFVILNLAPNDPTSVTNISNTGEANRSSDEGSSGELQYLLFREHYGLTLPILFNTWPSLSEEKTRAGLHRLIDQEEISTSIHHKLYTLWGDRARFIMPHLIREAITSYNPPPLRRLAANLFIRGGIKQGYVGTSLTPEQRRENREIAQTNVHLNKLRIYEEDDLELLEQKTAGLLSWFEEGGGEKAFVWGRLDKVKTLFFETRFFRYLSRVVTLDFGTLRNDSNKTVTSEVAKRIKYSLTLAVIPMILTFVLCQIFGMWMATHQNRWPDLSLSILFLILFAIPIFVVAPFLIDKFALHKMLPFTNIPIPYSGFHSNLENYETFTSIQKVGDIMLHLFLPFIAITYGTLAVQARISRTAFLEVMRQDFVRTARAKGLAKLHVLIRHVGRNGAITIVTSLAASLGVILGGSLIVETIFEINGFGKFFYEAILNRDFNVVLFSAFAGSFLTLIGYLAADIAYTLLDPRISLE